MRGVLAVVVMILVVLVLVLAAYGLGFGAGMVSVVCPTATVAPTATVTPTATATLTPAAVPTVTATAGPRILWDDRLTGYRVSVECSGSERYELVAAWITENGQGWPAWADDWMRSFPEAGADHHVLGVTLDRFGRIVAGKTYELVWPDGHDGRQAEASGWANFPLYAGYDPRVGPGPYRFRPLGACWMVGLGLPFKWHVSWFGVWREKGSPLMQLADGG